MGLSWRTCNELVKKFDKIYNYKNKDDDIIHLISNKFKKQCKEITIWSDYLFQCKDFMIASKRILYELDLN